MEKEKRWVARIDFFSTFLGCDEVQWLDVTIRGSTATADVEGAAKNGGHASLQGERGKNAKT